MSNKPKGISIHPYNKLSNIEVKYNRIIMNAKYMSRKYGFSKHVGNIRHAIQIIHSISRSI